MDIWKEWCVVIGNTSAEFVLYVYQLPSKRICFHKQSNKFLNSIYDAESNSGY